MPKTMKQPRKDVLREQLALAAEEIIQGRRRISQLEHLLSDTNGALDRVCPRWREYPLPPWWRRLLAWGRA